MTASGSARFIGYPRNHLLAAFRDPAAAAAAADEIIGAGIQAGDVTMLRGKEGADRLDGTGASHGPIARVRRLISFAVMDQLPDMAMYERAVRDGGAVTMIRVLGDQRRAVVADALRRHGGHFINYYGRFSTEEVERWTGPEPDIPNVLRR